MERKLREPCNRRFEFTPNMITNVCYNKPTCEACDKQYEQEKVRQNESKQKRT